MRKADENRTVMEIVDTRIGEGSAYFKKYKEKYFEKECCDVLALLGVGSFKMFPSMFSINSMPDRLHIAQDNSECKVDAFFIEYKRGKKGRLSASQISTFASMKKLRIKIYVVKDWSDFKKLLLKLFPHV